MRWTVFFCCVACSAEDVDATRVGGSFDGPSMVSSDDLGGSPDATKTGPLLKFAVFGDARPPLPEDSSHYPTEILKAIFALAAAQNVQFVVGTGDYFYALSDAAVTAQLAKLKEAEAPFVGPIYHALGNHECLT